jgi:hypothetical protein
MKLQKYQIKHRIWFLVLAAALLASGCAPQPQSAAGIGQPEVAQAAELAAPGQAGDTAAGEAGDAAAVPTPYYTPRPNYQPAELVSYTAQTGDTLPALATRFNTSVPEILAANSFIPASATTMPPGMPMEIPIYYLPMWGTPFQILPDSLFINGPAQVGFDTRAFVDSQPGWLSSYSAFASGATRSGAEIVDLIALNYSLSPRLLLALLEHQSGALSQPASASNPDYAMGNLNRRYRGLYLQLAWAANQLNDGYYRWRRGSQVEFTFTNGRLERPDPWQNAATVGLHNLFLQLDRQQERFNQLVSPDGFVTVYTRLFGDPWANDEPHLPGSLVQPEFLLPFERDTVWAYTGGPHTAWGVGEPLAALDFAPPAVKSGCQETQLWATAVAPGVVSRSEEGIVELDLDGDGDPRTGWTVFYLHIGTEGRVPVGTLLETGQPLGHPSCEGGSSTGTHIHLARKYNGEWMLADGPLGFNLEGWVAHNGAAPYKGTLERFSQLVTACECSNAASFIKAERR